MVLLATISFGLFASIDAFKTSSFLNGKSDTSEYIQKADIEPGCDTNADLSRIRSERSCRRAAYALGYYGHFWSGAYDDLPVGCIVHLPADNDIHRAFKGVVYNTDSTGKTDAEGRPLGREGVHMICRRGGALFNWDGGDIDQRKNDWIENQGDAAGCSSVVDDPVECGGRKGCKWGKNALKKDACLYECDSNSAILFEAKNLNKYYSHSYLGTSRLRGAIGKLLSDGTQKNVSGVCDAILGKGGLTAECTNGHFTVVQNCIGKDLQARLISSGLAGPAFGDRSKCKNEDDLVTMVSFIETHEIRHVFSYSYEEGGKQYIRCYDIQTFATKLAMHDSKRTSTKNPLVDDLTRIEIPKDAINRARELIKILQDAGTDFVGADPAKIRQQNREENEAQMAAMREASVRWDAEELATPEEREEAERQAEIHAVARQQENMRNAGLGAEE